MPPPITPDTPVQFLKGVGEGRARLLADAGITTVRDFLFYFPYRYEDRRHPARVADLGRLIDTPVLLRGRVVSANARTTPMKRMRLFEAVLDDGTGSVRLVWFNQPYLSEQIARGDRLAVYGVPRRSAYGGGLAIESPDWEKFEGSDEEEGVIVPIYSKIGNIAPKALRKMIFSALDALPLVDDPLPEEIRAQLGVVELHGALRAIHQPPELSDEFLRQRSPAHLRMILQEFYSLQLALRVRRAHDEVQTKTRRIEIGDELRDEVKRILPFKLTGAQKRVLREIADDLRSSKPMYRLLQGDVGSGKTIIALIAAILMIRNGHQVALLAPTEILVEQHYQRIRQLLDHSLGHSIAVARATGSMTAGERRTLLAGLRDGYIQLAVGTHALLEERVKFKSLGLAIVDEQHRFGVEQRQKLFAKGAMPDILVMTATPIPRSLALAIYGDLELSVIDELPPGRQRIKTAVRAPHEADRVYDFIDEQIAAGAQTYIVYPIIEESEKLNLKPLSQGFEAMKKRFPNRRVAMMHGRMKTDEKEETMASFKRGEIDILVATTVIEVGIDVPNASIMLIVDADRFGLSQLHQLRGRVGRGTRKSYCVLLHDDRAAGEAKDRLRLFEQSRDGFEVAEHDLQIRGPGEFLGTRQSGALRFRMGNILRDYDLMEKARDLAIATIGKDLSYADDVAQRLLGMPVPEAAAKD
ncbi:MAG TPA: ATP-dependent DNA helicase RecG [Thermoanaerobaculia bacterium]|nr:ATP-dependent DNA helicase RecG [Thermoanaerobaculia bacterium]